MVTEIGYACIQTKVVDGDALQKGKKWTLTIHGDNSRLEPTKSMRTNNTPKVRKTSADTKRDGGAGGI